GRGRHVHRVVARDRRRMGDLAGRAVRVRVRTGDVAAHRVAGARGGEDQELGRTGGGRGRHRRSRVEQEGDGQTGGERAKADRPCSEQRPEKRLASAELHGVLLYRPTLTAVGELQARTKVDLSESRAVAPVFTAAA